MNFYEEWLSKLISLLIPKTHPSGLPDVYQYYGQVGDFFGGVWGTIIGAVTLLVVGLTWHSTRKIDKESKVYQVFAEMLRTHEEIVSSISIGEVKGRDTFALMLSEFYEIYAAINNCGIAKFNLLTVTQKINVAFVISYYGTYPTTPKILERDLPGYPFNELCGVIALKRKSAKLDMQVRDISEIIQRTGGQKLSAFKDAFRAVKASTISEPEKRYLSVTLQEIQKSSSLTKMSQAISDYIDVHSISMEFGGHQNRLSHYFRNLYSAFVFIDEQKISKAEKLSLAKVLRSKLSNYEQAMLALNSLSIQGSAWVSSDLIKKYSPIKNIPEHFFTFDLKFDLKSEFPSVVFEWERPIGRFERLLRLLQRTKS